MLSNGLEDEKLFTVLLQLPHADTRGQHLHIAFNLVGVGGSEPCLAQVDQVCV